MEPKYNGLLNRLGKFMLKPFESDTIRLNTLSFRFKLMTASKSLIPGILFLAFIEKSTRLDFIFVSS